MKNKYFLLIIVLLLVCVLGTIYIISNQKEDNNDNSDNVVEKNKEKNSSNNDTKSNFLVAKYKRFENTNNHYVENILNITNQTDSSIDFEIVAGEGSDTNHVNTGDLKGTAKLVEVPKDSIIPESTQYAYKYTETIDGKEYKITFVYTAHKKINLFYNYRGLS